MLFPKKVKHRKWQTQRRNMNKPLPKASRGTKLQHGSYALKATGMARIRSNQIEASRKVISRTLGKVGRYWIRIFPDRPVTAKAAEVGMGKGKGDLKGYCFEALPGRILFEVDGVPEDVAREALRKAGTKMPVTTKIVSREDMF